MVRAPINADALILRFADELAERMSSFGWLPDDQADTDRLGHCVGRFYLPTRGRLLPTAVFIVQNATCRDSPTKRPRVTARSAVVARAVVGVRCPAAEALLKDLIGRRSAECAVMREAGSLLHPPSDSAVYIEHWQEAVRAAEALANLASTQASRFAGEHTDVQALIAARRQPRDARRLNQAQRDAEMLAYASGAPPGGAPGGAALLALLAAAGDTGDARQAITAALSHAGHNEFDRDLRRFAHLLIRWLDTGATIQHSPSNAPRWDVPVLAGGYFQSLVRSLLWRRSRPDVAAYSAVRMMATLESRDELRAALSAERAKLGLTPNPLVTELMLRDIHTTNRPFSALARRRRYHNLFPDPGERPPAWAELPVHASYPVLRVTADLTAVDLSDDFLGWLRRLKAGKSDRRCLPLDIWFDCALRLSTSTARVLVHVGDQCAGTLDLAASQRFVPVLRAAKRHGEAPWIKAWLLDFCDDDPPSYLLVLPMPEAIDEVAYKTAGFGDSVWVNPDGTQPTG
jgi:hypothetical protein